MPGNWVGRFRTWAISASFKRVRTQQVTPEPGLGDCAQSTPAAESLFFEESAGPGSVDVSARAALLREISPGEAEGAGNGIPFSSPPTTHGEISRATRRAGPVLARCCVSRWLIWPAKLRTSCLASRKNWLRRGRAETSTDPEYFMSLALAEGKRALPACLPNPPVGCVLVREGRVVSRGHTQAPGQHHAEAMALAQLPSGSQQGLTAYVTLEPCSFHGRTPSCAHALVRQGIERVFIAILDPDPRNAGAGARILVDAGIEVIIGTGSEEAERDLRGYLLPGGA